GLHLAASTFKPIEEGFYSFSVDRFKFSACDCECGGAYVKAETGMTEQLRFEWDRANARKGIENPTAYCRQKRSNKAMCDSRLQLALIRAKRMQRVPPVALRHVTGLVGKFIFKGIPAIRK